MMKHLLVDPLLVNGDNLTRDEFIEIWEKFPEVKFAELIGGIVYLSTLRCSSRGEMNLDICAWLGIYNAYTPHGHGGANVTSFIGEDCPQPDDYLAIHEECGGRSFGSV
ncbi:MAG: hypothetical protein EXS16_17540 [Gemmataceae bacterium]|nr:hypothetical protein [Gemmataceae bacterium]